jgi:hypothetical protein
VVENDKDALVLAFSTWASLWDKSKPVYEKTARALAPVKNLALFTLDTNENLFESDKLGGEPGQYIDKKAWLVLFTSAGMCEWMVERREGDENGLAKAHNEISSSFCRGRKPQARALHGKNEQEGHSDVAEEAQRHGRLPV